MSFHSSKSFGNWVFAVEAGLGFDVNVNGVGDNIWGAHGERNIPDFPEHWSFFDST